MKAAGYLDGLKVIEMERFKDDRGFFMESYSQKKFAEIGIHNTFVQDNISYSVQDTLRGLHYQKWPGHQAKLIRCTLGEIFDVAVDIRPNSPTFFHYHSEVISEKNNKQFFIPNGFLHGFLVLSEVAVVQYKCDNFYDPELEAGYAWDSEAFAIEWPTQHPLLSTRDKAAPQFMPHL